MKSAESRLTAGIAPLTHRETCGRRSLDEPNGRTIRSVNTESKHYRYVRPIRPFELPSATGKRTEAPFRLVSDGETEYRSGALLKVTIYLRQTAT